VVVNNEKKFERTVTNSNASLTSLIEEKQTH